MLFDNYDNNFTWCEESMLPTKYLFLDRVTEGFMDKAKKIGSSLLALLRSLIAKFRKGISNLKSKFRKKKPVDKEAEEKSVTVTLKGIGNKAPVTGIPGVSTRMYDSEAFVEWCIFNTRLGMESKEDYDNKIDKYLKVIEERKGTSFELTITESHVHDTIKSLETLTKSLENMTSHMKEAEEEPFLQDRKTMDGDFDLGAAERRLLPIAKAQLAILNNVGSTLYNAAMKLIEKEE